MSSMGFIQSDLDLKFLILYIMARTAGPITFLQLFDLALCDAGVDYFSLTQAVDHMVETGQLDRQENRLAITDKGLRNSEICQSSLPYSVRMRCDENLIQVNEALRREAQVQSSITTHDDGTCILHLRLDDVGSPLINLDLLVSDHTQAEEMAQRFQADPPAFYHAIIQLFRNSNG